MSDKSAIEWTDATWNPTVGCTIVSPGCTNCYAMKQAHDLVRRFDSPKYRGLTKVVNGNPVWTGEVRLDEAALLQPLEWKRGRRIFVNSMSDLFHESLSDIDIDRVFAVMALCPQHTFQVLTKRAERMQAYMLTESRCHIIGDVMLKIAAIRAGFKCVPWPFPNVWLGVSAERQEEAAERIPLLLDTPAAVRFVSAEPLLGPINLTRLCVLPQKPGSFRAGIHVDALRNKHCESQVKRGLGPLDWIIVGGESGSKARPMHPDWARSLRDQCDAAGVPFFFKQWGEFAPTPPPECATHGIFENGHYYRGGHLMGATDTPDAIMNDLAREGGRYTLVTRYGKKAAGRLLDGREHNEFPVTDVSVMQSGSASHETAERAATS